VIIDVLLSVDPLAELMPEWSSYAYTFNNPVNFTDPTGMVPEGGGCDDPPCDPNYFDPNEVQQLDDVIVTASGRNDEDWSTEINLAGTSPHSRDNNSNMSLAAYGRKVGQNFNSLEDAELWYSRTVDKQIKDAWMKDFNAGRAAMLNDVAPFLFAPALAVVELELGVFALISQSAQAIARLGANNQLVRGFVIKSGTDSALQYRVTGDIDVISALAAGTGGKRYSIIFQAFASGFDYSINDGYSDVFGFSKNPAKPLSEMGVDFGVGMYNSLGGKIVSPSNSLGKWGANALSTSGGYFISERIKGK